MRRIEAAFEKLVGPGGCSVYSRVVAKMWDANADTQLRACPELVSCITAWLRCDLGAGVDKLLQQSDLQTSMLASCARITAGNTALYLSWPLGWRAPGRLCRLGRVCEPEHNSQLCCRAAVAAPTLLQLNMLAPSAHFLRLLCL